MCVYVVSADSFKHFRLTTTSHRTDTEITQSIIREIALDSVTEIIIGYFECPMRGNSFHGGREGVHENYLWFKLWSCDCFYDCDSISMVIPIDIDIVYTIRHVATFPETTVVSNFLLIIPF